MRQRLISTADQLAGVAPIDTSDEMAVHLSTHDHVQEQYIQRLRRAVVEFDTATVATIHAVCSKILTMAGLPVRDDGGEDLTSMFVNQVVNDALVANALLNNSGDSVPIELWNEFRVTEAVIARLGAPTATLWFDPFEDDGSPRSQEEIDFLEQTRELVDQCARKVMTLTREHPSYDDLVRRAEQVLGDPQYASTAKKFAERFSLAFVDEAQDTDDLQWKLFHHVFPANDPSAPCKLIAVGDPKQAIYAFRGADVYAYLKARDEHNMSTLTTNFRSDKPLVDALNNIFESKMLGEGIPYREISANDHHDTSKIHGVNPCEVIDLEDVSNQFQLAQVAANRVIQLLNNCQITLGNDTVPLEPHHVCVLVNSGNFGSMIERQLRRFGIPAVSNGTQSVFRDRTASHIRVLFQALERVSDSGRIRRLATTPFLGYSITDPRMFPPDMVRVDLNDQEGSNHESANLTDDLILHIQDVVTHWRSALTRKGVAALESAIMSNESVMQMFASGVEGERRLTDFAHIFDLLHEESEGQPVSPSKMLKWWDQYFAMDAQSEIVARRIESDANAVTIMTSHRAKGLEFPVVVAADFWKYPPYREHEDIPVYQRQGQRVIDIGWVVNRTSESSRVALGINAQEERARLMYVAFTRAQHHLTFMWASQLKTPTVISQLLDVEKFGQSLPLIHLSAIPSAKKWSPPRPVKDLQLDVAKSPEVIAETFQRTSFTRITAQQSGRTASLFTHTGSGNEETAQLFSARSRYASEHTPTGVVMPLARVPGGTHFGTVMHSVFENIDFTATPLRDEVQRAVRQHVTSRVLKDHIDDIVDGVERSLLTPLGPLLSHTSLTHITHTQRASEMAFDMSVSSISASVQVSDIGKLLQRVLPADDVLAPYAHVLADQSFEIPLSGLITGSIDTVINLGSDAEPRLFITDYKTNRLDTDADNQIIDAYAPARLYDAMVHHHYPLQALIYGAAVFRYLRWRRPHIDHNAAIAGVAYFFVRAMVGQETPTDEHGNPYGVFTWTPPREFWSQLSDVLAGNAVVGATS